MRAHFAKYSQIGQDYFGWCVTPSNNGTFLDIGCDDGVTGSNSLALEELGWTGLCLDHNVSAVAKANAARRCQCVCIDATTTDYGGFTSYDYLSLDVDEASLPALKQMTLHPLAFRAITAEHDFYSLGDARRSAMRAILAPTHELVFADIHYKGWSFEDWFVRRDLFVRFAPIQSTGLDYQECLAKLETLPPL